jgi:ubiquinol-cytochrome c reductase iron-sulfur subunit
MNRDRSELLVIALLLAAASAAIGFVVAYLEGSDTQALGITGGAAFAALASAAIVAGASVVRSTPSTESRPPYTYSGDESEANEEDDEVGLRDDLAAGLDGISRRKLLAGTAGLAGTALGGALLVPLASLGPDTDALTGSPWREGLKLVDENEIPIESKVLDEGSFLTAFPAGAEQNTFGAPIVVVRVDPATLELPAGREGWAPEGLLAFSKICTHAGCAVNLYRSPLYEPTSPSPALVCPCHYSTFDVRRGAQVVFGPAGRPLPQLPLRIADGLLVAAGKLSGRVGPAWRGVREQ